MYNLASPEMPEPNEKRFEVEYSESFQEVNITPFDDLPFSENSECWNTAFSCRVKIIDKRSLGRLAKKLDKWESSARDYLIVIDSWFRSTTPRQLFQEVVMAELQRTFDNDYRIGEDQELCAFSMRATVIQLDKALAYFGLKLSDMNVMKVGESNEIHTRRVMLFDSMLRVQKYDNGTFAASNRAVASVFWSFGDGRPERFQ